eukprot:1813958-Alexandrium_andersonii.AAC.1
MCRHLWKSGFEKACASTASGSSTCTAPFAESSPVVAAWGNLARPQDQPSGVHHPAGGAERASAEQAPAERASAEQASAERAAAERASAERAPAERASAERASA